MNVNYVGSVAERKMHFSSSVTVENSDGTNLFHAISLYVPLSFAVANIVDFDNAWVTEDTPAVIAVTVDNYAEEMQGELLAQWQPIFRDDTNIDVILYLIVFHDMDTVPTSWVIGEKFIKFAPLTSAFEKLHFISYLKFLFDPNYDGRDVIVPIVPGTPATAVFHLKNASETDPVTVDAGTYPYTHTDGSVWELVVPATIVVPAETTDDTDMTMSSVLNGDGGTLTSNDDLTVANLGEPPTLLATAVVQTVTDGIADIPATTRPSKYFDMVLALSYLCKINAKLSAYVAYVKIALPILAVDTNKCWIRSKDKAAQIAAMTSLITADRGRYLWGALYLMEASNTVLLAHSENTNILVDVFAAWFATKNSSGLYIGNKLSMLRLSGTRIKPFGVPSLLNSAINENDEVGFDMFDDMNIGYLMTINSKTEQECVLSMMRSVTGMPINALMISKYVDYASSQECADLVTEKGTLTNPILTDAQAYAKIQDIVNRNLLLFVGTRRIGKIVLSFPDFAIAKTGMTSLEAASAWSAVYTDDLDEVTVTGGITAQ